MGTIAAILLVITLAGEMPDRVGHDGKAVGHDGAVLMFWNVENFFDWRADGVSGSEVQFSASGARKWTKRRFYAKCNGIAKTILLAGDEFGEPPDIIGLAEVENRFVLTQLVGATALRKYGYGIVHYDSPDRRGIDCALLYRKSHWRVVSSKACRMPFPTRDILLVILQEMPDQVGHDGRGDGGPPVVIAGCDRQSPLAVLINHHPSKVGGESDERRNIAMARLLEIRDSLLAEGISRIIGVGDFNDEVVPAEGVTPTSSQGTIKFQGKWEKIDGCPVLEGLKARETVFCPPHLTEPDRGHSGTKPRRTYSGPRYKGGLSDHYPVVYRFY